MKFCPHCGGDLAAYEMAETQATSTRSERYEQTAIWRRLVGQGKAPPGELLAALKPSLRPPGPAPYRCVVHMMFDRNIVPTGGVLRRAMLLEGRTETSEAQLEAQGYFLEEGKVRTVDDVPISLAYAVLDYWGGEKQHRRWHLTKPVKLNPSRNGDPCFMDDNLLAFEAEWNDLERLHAAFTELVGLFSEFKGRCVAQVTLVDLFWFPA